MCTEITEKQAAQNREANKVQCHSCCDRHHEENLILCEFCEKKVCVTCFDKKEHRNNWNDTGWAVCTLCNNDPEVIQRELLKHIEYLTIKLMAEPDGLVGELVSVLKWNLYCMELAGFTQDARKGSLVEKLKAVLARAAEEIDNA